MAADLPTWIPPAVIGIICTVASGAIAWRVASAKQEGETSTEIANDKKLSEARELALRETLKERDAAFQTTVGKIEKNIAERDEVLRQDIRDLREDFTSGLDDIRKSQAANGERSAAQDKVNIYTAEAMQRLVITQERHTEKLADHASMIKLLTDIVAEEREQRKARENREHVK